MYCDHKYYGWSYVKIQVSNEVVDVPQDILYLVLKDLTYFNILYG